MNDTSIQELIDDNTLDEKIKDYKDYGVPLSNSKRPGILQPAMPWRFRVVFPKLSDDLSRDLTSQVMNFEIDMAKSKIEFQIRQGVDGTPLGAIEKLFFSSSELTTNIRLESLDGSNSGIQFYMDFAAYNFQHKLRFDYSNGDFLTHDIKADYKLRSMFGKGGIV